GSAVRLLRVHLAGGASAGTLLSDLTRQHGLDVSLVQARVEDIKGVAVGTVFVLVQGAPNAVAHALADLAAREIPVEEIAHESATDRPAHHLAA
ncbi:NIL domain-containing protein, partial [Bordetella petrii]|uniref:NIL domain-containing protein n=1 Tax=Bordetella petrii TaxID=94624 RepID=UPI002E79189D